MYKNFILTEAEKERILNSHKAHGYKQPLNEHVDNKAAVQVHKLALNPNLVSRMQAIITSLSDEKIAELEMVLDRLGINASSTPQEIHNKIEAKVHGEDKPMEMPENMNGELSKDHQAKRDMIHTFRTIGGLNIAAWGGVPAGIILGTFLNHNFAAGLAASWGATSVLYIAARLLEKSMEKKEPLAEDELNQTNDLIGKSVTLYSNEQDAKTAQSGAKTVTNAEGVLVGKIESVDTNQQDGVTLGIVLGNDKLDMKPNTGSSTTQFFKFDKASGTFKSGNADPKVYYNFSLRDALNGKYFQTDFASKNAQVPKFATPNNVA